jgi:transcriptional regulator with XRE-family HTH domain
MKLLFTNEGLRRKIANDPNDEPTAGQVSFAVQGAETEKVAVMGERNVIQMRIALGTFVRQLRRREGLSLSQLSERAHVSEDELRQVEHNPNYTARSRLIFQLSEYFNVPLVQLSVLSGNTHAVSRVFYNEVVKYAARSDDVSTLTVEERETLEAFVALLHDRAKA